MTLKWLTSTGKSHVSLWKKLFSKFRNSKKHVFKEIFDKVPQGLVLGLLLFLIYIYIYIYIYINNIVLEIESICKILPNDRPFFTVVMTTDNHKMLCMKIWIFFVSGPTNAKCFLILILINKNRRFIFHENKFIPQISHHLLLATQFKYALLRNASFFYTVISILF